MERYWLGRTSSGSVRLFLDKDKAFKSRYLFLDAFDEMGGNPIESYYWNYDRNRYEIKNNEEHF